jgi:hypothetical protein
VLYTDGLIESHTRDRTEGMAVLRGALSALIRGLTGGRHDDVALLYVH